MWTPVRIIIATFVVGAFRHCCSIGAHDPALLSQLHRLIVRKVAVHLVGKPVKQYTASDMMTKPLNKTPEARTKRNKCRQEDQPGLKFVGTLSHSVSQVSEKMQ